MSSQELAGNFDPANLIGNVAVPRAILPSLRSAKRRLDPDGGSSFPYFAGVSGKKLDFEFTDSAFAVLTDSVTFTSNSYAQLLVDLNAVDPINLEALDADGFLVIRNRNPGGAGYLKITAQAAPGDEAAGLLGFIVAPYPGHVSYAGEVTSTPGNRSQLNPQGTALLSRDEDLSADAINRGFVSVLRSLDLVRSDLEREVLVPHEVYVTVQTHPITGSPGFFYDDPTLRLPIANIYVSGPTTIGTLDAYFDLLRQGVFQANEQIFDSTLGKIQVIRGHYSSNLTGLNTSTSFAAWGTPDGKGIYNGDVTQKVKHASAVISSIRGNVLYCPGATFTSKFVQKNDPIVISGATNAVPFDHNGVFAVLKVIDNEHISVRPLGGSEGASWPAPLNGGRPKALNASGTGFGSVTAYFGDFVPCSQMWFSLVFNPGAGTYPLRLMVGRSLRESFGNVPSLHGHSTAMQTFLNDHLTDPADAHAASAITGFTSATVWKDGSTIVGTTLKDTIENILTDLSAIASSANGGSYRIGAPAYTTTGGQSQKTITSGSVGSQVESLLTSQRDHEVDEIAHSETGYISGLALGTYVFPNLPIAGGTVVAQYSGERKVYTVASTSFALAGNQHYWIYLDLADGITKIVSTYGSAPTAFSATAFPLYHVFTQGFGITYTVDLRRSLSSSHLRGFVTVGAGGDFTTFEGAAEWISFSRDVAVRTWEILIQGDVTMAIAANLSFPVVVRGAAVDGATSPKAILRTPDGTSAISAGVSVDGRVHFRDLYIKMSTTVANTTFMTGFSTGDDRRFENCVFDGGCFNGGTNLITSENGGTLCKGWSFINCVFKNAVCSSGTNYYIKLGLNTEQALIKHCRFTGSTANAFLGGIRFDSSNDNTVEDCYIDTGGKHVVFSTTGLRNIVHRNRCFNSRGSSLEMTGLGDTVFEANWITNCAVTSGPAINIATTSTGSGVVRDNRITDWQNGAAITISGSSITGHRVERNICRTSSGFASANIGVSVGASQDFNFVSFNEIDLSVGASYDNGKPGGIGISCAAGTYGFTNITNNLIANCGSAATPGKGIVAQLRNVISGNSFLNCRGTIIQDQYGTCVIQGNLMASGTADTGISMTGDGSLAVGNVIPGHSVPISSLPSSGASNQALGNSTTVVGPTPVGLRSGFIRKRVNANIGSRTVAAGITLSVATIPQPPNGYGVHYFEHVSLPAKVNNLEPGVRITYHDDSTSVAFNTTGATSTVRTDDWNAAANFTATTYLDLTNDKAISKVEIVVRNPSGASDTQSLGQYTYYGWVVA